MAEVTRWLPRISVSAWRNGPWSARARKQAAGGGGRTLGPAAPHEVLDRHVLVLQPLRFVSAASSRRASRCVTKTWPGAAPGPVTCGRRPSSASSSVRSRSGSAPACLQQPRHQALGLVEQREQQVLAVDLGVAEAQRLGLRVVQRLLGLLGQAVHVHGRHSSAVGRCPELAALQAAMRSSRSTTSPRAA